MLMTHLIATVFGYLLCKLAPFERIAKHDDLFRLFGKEHLKNLAAMQRSVNVNSQFIRVELTEVFVPFSGFPHINVTRVPFTYESFVNETLAFFANG
jgi:hypothetical protein